MTHFKYLKISKSKKIRFICNIYKNAPFIVFLHGFMSDLEGKKPNAFLRFAKQNKLSFLANFKKALGFFPSKSDIKPCKKTIKGLFLLML